MIEDCMEEFRNINLRMELKVIFDGEFKDAALDAGGMSREWFSLVAEEILTPEKCKPIPYLTFI